MRVGWMWQLKPRERALTGDMVEAIRYYVYKYSRQPNRVHVPMALAGEVWTVCDIPVISDRLVPEGCIWIGREEDINEDVYKYSDKEAKEDLGSSGRAGDTKHVSATSELLPDTAHSI